MLYDRDNAVVSSLFATEEGDLTIVFFSFSLQSQYHVGMEGNVIKVSTHHLERIFILTKAFFVS